MIYAGIGARKTPGDILHAMVQVGTFMAAEGATLRSGGAQGADRAFEIGCDFNSNGRKYSLKEIYLPSPGWQSNESEHHDVSYEAMRVASMFHPGWGRLDPFVKRLMGRNTYQMLGLDLKTPANFVCCWTLNGGIVGGTGQALRMAAYYGIPVINFGHLSFSEVNNRIIAILEANDAA